MHRAVAFAARAGQAPRSLSPPTGASSRLLLARRLRNYVVSSFAEELTNARAVSRAYVTGF